MDVSAHNPKIGQCFTHPKNDQHDAFAVFSLDDETGSRVSFYFKSPSDMRELADALRELADMLEEIQS